MAWAWYPRYPGDYKRDTSHLSLTEHGAYALLMDYYYSKGPIPVNGGSKQASLDTSHDDRVMRICSAFDAQEREAVAAVLDQFFTVKDGHYHNKKADEILESRDEISEKRKRAVEIREAKKNKNKSHDTSHDKPHDPSLDISSDHTTTTTTTRDKVSDTKVSSCGPRTTTYLTNDGYFMDFEQVVDFLWQDYPRVGRTIKGKKKLGDQLEKLLKKEGKNGDDWKGTIAVVAAGVRRFRDYCNSTGELPPDPWRWLRDGGHTEDYAYSKASNQGNKSGGTQARGGVDQIVNAAEKAKQALR